jgi:hypothetical protein
MWPTVILYFDSIMSRFDVITGSAPHATPALDINRYRDAALILRADGEVVPKRNEFGVRWGARLCGPIAIEGAAERLSDLAQSSEVGAFASHRAARLASALMHAIPQA